jgi:hypothetical protein
MATQTDTPRDPESRGLRLTPALPALTVVSGLIDAVGWSCTTAWPSPCWWRRWCRRPWR